MTALSILSPRQEQVLAFIRWHMVRHDRPPTCREIAVRFGFAHPTGAAYYLRALTRKGLIRPDRAGQNPHYVPAAGELVVIPDADRVRVGTTGPVALTLAEWRAWLTARLAELEGAA